MSAKYASPRSTKPSISPSYTSLRTSLHPVRVILSMAAEYDPGLGRRRKGRAREPSKVAGFDHIPLSKANQRDRCSRLPVFATRTEPGHRPPIRTPSMLLLRTTGSTVTPYCQPSSQSTYRPESLADQSAGFPAWNPRGSKSCPEELVE